LAVRFMRFWHCKNLCVVHRYPQHGEARTQKSIANRLDFANGIAKPQTLQLVCHHDFVILIRLWGRGQFGRRTCSMASDSLS
jgi:hypothetical protein